MILKYVQLLYIGKVCHKCTCKNATMAILVLGDLTQKNNHFCVEPHRKVKASKATVDVMGIFPRAPKQYIH